MVSKEELRKLDKEQLVDLVYDLLIWVDIMLAEVQVHKEEVTDLKREVKRLKSPKNSDNSSLPPSHDLFRFKNQSLRVKSNKKLVDNPAIRAKCS